MTVRALAAALGITGAGAHKCIKRGMPIDSIEAAQSWYQRNGRSRIASQPRPAPSPTPVEISTENEDPPEPAEAVAEPVKTFTDTDSCREALNEQRQLRKHAAAQVARLHHSGDIEASRRWSQTHQQYSAKQLTYERQWRDLLERDRRTIQIEDADRTFRAVLQDVRTLAASMPAALSAKVNPQDPVLAQKLLEEWRDKTLFKAIYEKANS